MDIIFEPERKTSLGNYDVAVEEDRKHPAKSSQANMIMDNYCPWYLIDINAHMGMS